MAENDVKQRKIQRLCYVNKEPQTKILRFFCIYAIITWTLKFVKISTA